MRLECTKKLLDYIGVKPEKAEADVDPIFRWTANLITLNRRKTLVAMNQASHCMFVLHGLTAKSLKKLPELLLEGVRGLLQSEYVRPEIIERYLDDCGRQVTFGANASRSVVTYCNKACERVNMFGDLFEAGDLYQRTLLPWLNEDLIPSEKYAYTHEVLLRQLKEHYGESVQSCSAFELEVTLELYSLCQRRIIVPGNLNFYQLHRILQEAFEWRDCHLHQFVLEQDRYGRPLKVIQPEYAADALEEEDYLNSQCVTVEQVFHSYSKIEYEYDFGDGWCHRIECLRVIEDCPNPYPHCVQAVGDAPMENCGGPGGFAEMMAIMKDPSHPQHAEVSEWVRGSWWQPLNMERTNYRLRNAHRRPFHVYYG